MGNIILEILETIFFGQKLAVEYVECQNKMFNRFTQGKGA